MDYGVGHDETVEDPIVQVTVLFFRPNMKSQPLDQGIISAIKKSNEPPR